MSSYAIYKKTIINKFVLDKRTSEEKNCLVISFVDNLGKKHEFKILWLKEMKDLITQLNKNFFNIDKDTKSNLLNALKCKSNQGYIFSNIRNFI